MTRTVKIGVVQEAWTSDRETHLQNIRKRIIQASATGASLVLLQELTLHRYFGDKQKGDEEVLALAEPLQGITAEKIGAFAKEANVFVIASIYEKLEQEGKIIYYNTAIILNPEGKLHAFTRKQHIPSGTGYNETFFFSAGDSDYPVHDLGFIKVAIPTCYDQWFPELARIYALKGAELICYPTAIGSEPEHPGFDSQPLWERVMTGHAVANGIFIAAANRIGNEGTVTLYGSSLILNPMGELLAKAPRDKCDTLVAELNFDQFNFYRKLFPLLHQRQPSTYKKIVE